MQHANAGSIGIKVQIVVVDDVDNLAAIPIHGAE